MIRLGFWALTRYTFRYTFYKEGIHIKSEAKIQSEIMVALSQRGHKVFRTNAGKIQDARTGMWVKLLPKGFPDIMGWDKDNGQFLAIEVKNEKGKLRPEQVKFSEFAKSQPILYGVARNVEEAIEIVEGQSDESETEKEIISK